MNEKPLERLNYFNGQRLQAADFKLEQDYQMRVRRWLNRSLYTPGIASGLEVYKIKDAPRVKVLPGLAIDHLGREIILLEERDIDVTGHGTSNGSACSGPYLTIRYQEDVIAQQDACCAVGGDSAEKPAWGGPARILAEPVLELNAYLPHESSGKIALACVTLTKGCDKVEMVDAGVRRYVGKVSEAKLRQYALEGERHVDAANAGKIYFHIRGRQPNAVTLYLRAEKFSTLYYTEMGQHQHALSVAFEDHVYPEHAHSLGGISTPEGGGHGHIMFANMGDFAPPDLDPIGAPPRYNAFAFTYRPGTPGAPDGIYDRHNATDLMSHLALGLSFGGGGHGHTFAAGTDTGTYPQKTFPHTPTANSQSDSHGAGVQDVKARDGATEKALTYVKGLKVVIDTHDVTAAIVEQLKNADPDWLDHSNDLLGDGSAGHPLAAKGSGPIKLDFLAGLGFTEGEHVIELSVIGAGNGGRILYNLYVE